LDRAERLAGRRFYELHLEAAALRHRKGLNMVELRIGNQCIKFRTPSARALWRAETLLDKEPATIRWINSFEVGEVLWDIGANMGIYSLYAAAVKSAQVLAFEPAAFNYMLLCDNVRLNRLEDRVAAYALAFSDRSELGTLTIADDEPGAAVTSVGDLPVGCLRQAALVYTVDEFFAGFASAFPAHIKIDVDGLEAEILQGSRHTLADPRLKSLLVEVDERDGSRPEHINSLLGIFGFRPVEIEGSPLAPNSASRNRIYRRAGA
jgi:FkbM family methyltransferase